MLMYKEYYLTELFSKNYTDSMPKWLETEAEKEASVFHDFIKFEATRKRKLRILDVGCGDCRLYEDDIFYPCDYPNFQFNKIACDLFNARDLPQDFKNWLAFNEIKYKQIKSKPKKIWGKFDIITSWGLDALLTDKQAKEYLNTSIDMLKEDGIMIWQTQRKDTLKGWWLDLKDNHLRYKYRPLSFYENFGFKEPFKYSTKVSHIYVGRKYAKE